MSDATSLLSAVGAALTACAALGVDPAPVSARLARRRRTPWAS